MRLSTAAAVCSFVLQANAARVRLPEKFKNKDTLAAFQEEPQRSNEAALAEESHKSSVGCPAQVPCVGGAYFCPTNHGCFERDQPWGCDVPLCAPGGGSAVPPTPPPPPAPPPAPPPEGSLDGCPANPPCCPSCWFCRANGGCYGAAHDPGCGVALCPPRGIAPAPPPPPTPAPAPPPPAPSPSPLPPPAPWVPPEPWVPSSDVLQPVAVNSPPVNLFPPDGGIHRPPNRVEVPRPHQTNKFWANWISTRNREAQKTIYVMPYSLLWSSDSQDWVCHYYETGQDNAWCQSSPTEGNQMYQYFAPGSAPATCGWCECCKRAIEVRAQLIISHQLTPQYHYNTGAWRNSRAGRMAFYITRFVGDYALGAVEQTSDQHYAIVREDLIGIHALVRGRDSSDRTIRFPVYSGMAYVSGKYNRFTPRIASPQGYIKEVTKVQQGIWHFKNDAGDPNKLWECHYYENGQNDAWCQSNPILDDGHQEWEVSYRGLGGECDPCKCCKRPRQDPEDLNGDWGTIYRVYVLDEAGNFADGDFHNTSSGFAFNRELNGWVRVAHVAEPGDVATLDAHAGRILEAVNLEVETSADFHYNFETSGRNDVELLHWAWGHQQKIMDFSGADAPKFPTGVITPLVAPTGGAMTPLLGTRWSLHIDLSGAQQVDFLPATEPQGAQRDEVAARLNDGLINDIAAEACMRSTWATPECERPRTFLFTNGFYTNGKGLQKVAYYCLMAERLFGAGDQRTQTCIDLLERAFRCHFDPSQGCGGVPTAYYDTQWGGVAGRQGFHTEMCGLADFGNACYNDHHYHYGYFIAPAAALLKLRPAMAREAGFMDYINSMVRDTANPSTDDRYFPQFRAFDFYDLHSWSHGVTPSADGKDEESTSEDINFYFGVQMWGRLTGNRALEQTGAMLLSLTAHTVKELFLMRTGNTAHHPDYVKNHVTGIFFQNKAHYGTFFGADEWFIHGVQMLPLSPALLLARTPEFCSEEWNDILSRINLGAASPGWASLLLTGNLAIIDPNRAFDMIKGLGNNLDNGLSGAWALYWAAALAAR